MIEDMNMKFATPENMAKFWGFVRMLLESVSPFVMIGFAVTAVGILLTIIISTFRKAHKEHENDDDDYDVRHY